MSDICGNRRTLHTDFRTLHTRLPYIAHQSPYFTHPALYGPPQIVWLSGVLKRLKLLKLFFKTLKTRLPVDNLRTSHTLHALMANVCPLRTRAPDSALPDAAEKDAAPIFALKMVLGVRQWRASTLRPRQRPTRSIVERRWPRSLGLALG